MQNLAGLRVTVMGLGRFGGGVGVTRWLVEQGARVLLTDRDSAAALQRSVAQIADLPVTLRLGEHREEDFTATDLVIVNPAVPDHSPFVQAARGAGVPLSTEINLFVERCRAITVGITGSVGKSTTTTMVGCVLERAWKRGRAWIGGNLGRSLLADLPQMTGEDVVVLELSSFQLHRTPLVGWSPHVALISNLTPNHLDWHGSFAAYADDKWNIARHQQGDRAHLILGESVPLARDLPRRAGEAWRYGVSGDGVPRLQRTEPATEQRFPDLRLAVPGRHNLENAAGALGVARCLGIDLDAAMDALRAFQGREHRLQRVCERDGVTYFNDSKSTTPEAALTAIGAFDGPLLLILGGYDKGSDLSPVAELAARRAKLAACLGTTGPRIAERVNAAGGRAALVTSLEDAVRACEAAAVPGDTILLSPACASWGMFEDFRQRGDLFAALARGATAQRG